MSEMDKWTWPARPTTDAEYCEMMVSLDHHLAVHGLPPEKRSFQASRLVSIALGLSGTPIIGPNLPRGEPFSPSDLLARVFEWFNDTYGDRNKIDWALGHVVLQLRGTYWRLRIPLSYGTVIPFASRDLTNTGRNLGTKTEPPTHNVLTSMKGITQTYADRLTDAELAHVLGSYAAGYAAMCALDALKGHDFFTEARGDYKHSVDALIDGPTLSKARWDGAQCAEKIFKGLLAQAGHPYPTGGAKGHDIVHLGGLIKTHFGVAIPDGVLRAIHCPTAVRYGEMNVDQNEAWTSHMDLLTALRAVSTIKQPGARRR